MDLPIPTTLPNPIRPGSFSSTPVATASRPQPTSVQLDRFLEQLEQERESSVSFSYSKPRHEFHNSRDTGGVTPTHNTTTYRNKSPTPRMEEADPSDGEAEDVTSIMFEHPDRPERRAITSPTSPKVIPSRRRDESTPKTAETDQGTLELLLKEMQLNRERADNTLITVMQALQTSTQHRAYLDSIPQCQPMHAKDSISDYLRLFEETQIARMAPREQWPHILIPLLNKAAKDVVTEVLI